MSKYLMKSAAAIVLGLAATACSHDFDVVEKVEQQSIDNAQQTLGFYIPENQDWVMTTKVTANLPIIGEAGKTYTVRVFSNEPLTDGIGYVLTDDEVVSGQNFVATFRMPSYKTNLVIGITDSEGYTAYKRGDVVNGQITSLTDINSLRTRGENANRNEWADPDKAYGGWIVPPALTDGQKERVYKYFQTHPDITYEDPHLTDFFVQQVYKGKDDAMSGTYQGNRTFSAEEYQSANSDMVTGSNHMDLLTCGYGKEMGAGYEGASATHYYDHIGDFNNGTYNGGGTVTVLNNGQHVGGATHEDQISLMVNSRTDCIGYWNSDGSCGHNDRCALVDAKVIDDWARAQSPVIGEDVWYGKDKDGIDNSYWDRHFVGLDFDQVIGNDIYAKGVSRPDENGNWVYYPDEYATFEFEGNTYHFLNSNTNFYCADRSEPKYGGVYNPGNEPDADTKRELLQLGYRPYDTALHDWCKVGGCADGFYTDWIVTLTPGRNTKNPPVKYQTYTYAFEDNRARCDYDLNDVVLQVKYKEGSDKAQLEIKLVAAGCEYDNYVYLGSTLIEWAGGAEVHDALGVRKGQMVNTGGGKAIEANPVTKIINTPTGFDFQEADFKIKPYKTNADLTIDEPLEKTNDGFIDIIKEGNPNGLPKAPVGIVIPIEWKWPIERTNVTNAYPKFVAWGKQVDVDLRKVESDWYESPVAGRVIE